MVDEKKEAVSRKMLHPHRFQTPNITMYAVVNGHHPTKKHKKTAGSHMFRGLIQALVER